MSTQQRWYYSSKPGATEGPVTEEELIRMISGGSLAPRDKVVPEGSQEWKAIEESSLSGHLGASSKPIPPAPTGMDRGSAPPAVAISAIDEFKELGTVFPLLPKRAFSSDFHEEMATEQELAQLAQSTGRTPPPTIANFACWRRAVLAIGAALMVLGFIFALPSFVKSFDQSGVPGYFRFLEIMGLLVPMATIYLMVMALLNWKHYRRSRSFGRLAMMVGLLVPFGLGLLPVRWFISDLYTPSTIQLASIAVGYHAMVLIPLVISVFPAFLRSSLVMKSLVPESTLSGWIALIIAPFSTLFFLIGLVITMQVGNFPSILTFFALTVAPLVILASVTKLIQPARPEDANQTLASIRTGIFSCYGVSIVGAIWLLFTMDNVEWFSVFQVIFKLVGNILLFNIVISDYFLGLIGHSFREEKSLHTGELIKDLEKRMEQTTELVGNGNSQ